MVYHPTTRVLTVLELLQAYPQLSGAELAERLEVDRRTVRRYITMLQDLGIPVEASRGPLGGYRLRPGFKLPPLMLNEEEALAVTLGLLAGRHLGLEAATPAIEGALAKIDRVLPETLAVRVRAVQTALGFTAPPRGSGPPAPAATIIALAEAVERRRQVQIRYRARRGEVSERLLDPYGLVHHRGRWYLAGYDHSRNSLRTFRVDRVDDVAMGEETFERPPDFDAVAHVVRSLATVPFGWTLEVLLDLPMEDARQRVAPTHATLEETPAGVLLRSSAEHLDGAARYLVSLGCSFVVLQPAALRDALRQLATEIAATAERPAEADCV
jgi:predicted DNA-binding transcriptional regulator YafY